MQKLFLTPKKARRSIIERVQSHLGRAGFSIHDETTSWRMSNVKVDILHFDLLSPAICRKWRVPVGSFCLFPECFFPALPSLSDTWEACDSSTPLQYPVSATRAQLRWQVFKGIHQSNCPQKTVYGLTKEENIVDYLADDISTSLIESYYLFGHNIMIHRNYYCTHFEKKMTSPGEIKKGLSILVLGVPTSGYSILGSRHCGWKIMHWPYRR